MTAVTHARPLGRTVLSLLSVMIMLGTGVAWGLDLGIRCFQGHFIDKVVEAMVNKGLIK